MTDETVTAESPRVRIERTYEATVQELWDLWTTKDGFESWWGPDGFRVEVHAIEPRVGGALVYDMIAASPEHIAFMEKAGMPTSQATRGTFVAVEPLERLAIVHVIDFVPGVEPYENRIAVEFFPEGRSVRMCVLLDPHPDAEWTRMAVEGFTSQLTKVPAALAARR